MLDIAPFIDILIAFAAFITIAFAATEVAGYYNTRSANNSIVQTANTTITAVGAMTGVYVTAQQAMTIAEITGVPTQIVTPKDKAVVS